MSHTTIPSLSCEFFLAFESNVEIKEIEERKIDKRNRNESMTSHKTTLDFTHRIHNFYFLFQQK